jgi:2-polyprenyl-6-methoxyphenol hydroxylase-like FAD-dependent oxidoreductase
MPRPLEASLPPRGHAVVIGGSMAGLWTARILAEHFAKVTIVERDRFPDEPTPRKGVPQARHVHILLVGGMRVLHQLFPGLEEELAAVGAPEVDWLNDCRSLASTGWLARFPSGIVSRTSSRALLEWTMRRRLAANPAITFLQEHDVIGLLTDEAQARVTGVTIRKREGNRLGESAALHADLTIDASGRDTKTPEWLKELGYGETEETVINSFLGYATRWYRKPAGFKGDWKALFYLSRPPHFPRGGVLYPVEGDTWAATLAGTAHDYPPQDEAGFLEFARSLPEPDFYEAIKDAEPLTPVYGYRRTENKLRHYERLPRWPLGYAALGDAVCAFNPVYGQGMTASANAALVLDRCLRAARGGDLAAVTPRFQREVAKTNATPWTLATSEDFRWPTTEGGQPDRMTRLMHAYMNQVVGLVGERPAVAQSFIEVVQLAAPPTILFKPHVLGPVLRRVLSRQGRKNSATARSLAPDKATV